METAHAGLHRNACGPEECDTFQFMAKHLGVTVLHPGGLAATRRLAERCGISPGMTVLDAGCGSGSGSVLLARRFGCRVVGVDADHSLLLKAQDAARRARVLDKVAFRRADLHELPFGDGTFDGAIAQAVLIFTDKRRALQQISRKVRRGGFFGSVELTWRRPPSAETVDRVKAALCAVAANAEQRDGWIGLFQGAGLNVVEAEIRDLDFSFLGMLANEGLLRTLRIAARSLREGSTRRRTQELTHLFEDVKQDLGYGLCVARRP